MPSCSKHSSPDAALLRLAKARLRWRRAADELLIDVIFEDMRVVRRDGECTGRAMRRSALLSQALAPAMAPAMLPAMVRVQSTGARQAPAPMV